MVSLEFALTGLLLITMIAATIDFSRLLATRNSLRAAVAEATRQAIVDTTMAGCATPETHALRFVTLLTARDLTLCVTRGNRTVTVTAEYAFRFVVPILGTAPRTLRATVTSPA